MLDDTPAMKLVILACVLLFAPVARAEPAPIQVTAKVVELPKRIVMCGVIAYRAVVRYEVVSVERGKLTARELLVVELCPEFLKTGQVKKLRLWPATRNDSFVDDFKARPGPRYVHRDIET